MKSQRYISSLVSAEEVEETVRRYENVKGTEYCPTREVVEKHRVIEELMKQLSINELCSGCGDANFRFRENLS